MKLKLILNPASGNGKAERRWPEIQKILDQRGIAYDLERTGGPGQATPLAKNAVQSGFDPIVAIGGDGLINEVANGMIGSKATLGLIPCGDANDFSRMFGISENNLEEACEVLIEGFTKAIDVGMVNDRCFLNVVGIGFDGEVSERKSKSTGLLRGFWGYYVHTVLTLFTYKPKPVELKIDGVSRDTLLFFITIGNGRYCGDGFLLTPNAELDDGLLDVCLVKYPGKLKALWDIAKASKGKHVRLPYVTMLRAGEIRVASETPLTAHVDGEIAKENEYNIKILPQKIKVLAKKTAR